MEKLLALYHCRQFFTNCVSFLCVIPAKAGIQDFGMDLDSRFRGNDKHYYLFPPPRKRYLFGDSSRSVKWSAASINFEEVDLPNETTST